MKRYIKELIILVLQMLLFYVLPLFAGPTDAMGMVVLIILGTFLLALVMGTICPPGAKWAFPAAAALLFMPSIPLYYNFSAMVHAVWYFVVATAGLAVGSSLRWIAGKLRRH